MISRRLLFSQIGLAAVFSDISPSFAQHSRPKSEPASDLVAGISPNVDVTEALERALAAAEREKIGEIVLPAGDFFARSVMLHNGVKLKGMGRSATRLHAAKGGNGSFVTLSAGPVVNASLESMCLVGGRDAGTNDASRWAVDLQARPMAAPKPQNGGFWWSMIQDVAIVGFSKGVRLLGGSIPGNFSLPHQFLSFRDLVVFLPQDAVGPALKISGQASQFAFQQCHFDHHGGIGEFNLVEIGAVGETAASKWAEPSVVQFDVCTFQKARQAVVLSRAQNVRFSSCWFEQVHGGIVAQQRSLGIVIDSSRFANAGDVTPAVEFKEKCHGTISSNIFAGRQTRYSMLVASASEVLVSNNFITSGAGK